MIDGTGPNARGRRYGPDAKLQGMGITYCDAMMLWSAKKRGVTFDRVLSVGHQCLYLHRRELTFLKGEYRTATGSSGTPLDGYRWGDYADGFLSGFLEASAVTVLDMSDYEGADILHDLNTPVPTSWHGQYDVVIDGGSLEHIFNVPCAIANLGNLLKVGGTVFITTPANNQMGHGFYQFSPELMFRVFSAANGFSLRNVWLVEGRYPDVQLTKNHDVYEVVDPQKVQTRVGLVSKRPVTMMIEATKLRDTEMFTHPPIQSDYATVWDSAGAEQVGTYPGGIRERVRIAAVRIIQVLPVGVRAPIEGRRQKRKYSLRNSDYYKHRRLRPYRARSSPRVW